MFLDVSFFVGLGVGLGVARTLVSGTGNGAIVGSGIISIDGVESFFYFSRSRLAGPASQGGSSCLFVTTVSSTPSPS